MPNSGCDAPVKLNVASMSSLIASKPLSIPPENPGPCGFGEPARDVASLMDDVQRHEEEPR